MKKIYSGFSWVFLGIFTVTVVAAVGMLIFALVSLVQGNSSTALGSGAAVIVMLICGWISISLSMWCDKKAKTDAVATN